MLRFLFLFLVISNTCLFSQVQWIGGRMHDFGEIASNKQVSHTFVFKNLSKGTLTIETSRTTCGCTATSFSSESIQPGEQGQVVVTFDGQIPIGNKFKKKVKVYFREQKKGETLRIKGSTL
jgi:hypothetical protein